MTKKPLIMNDVYSDGELGDGIFNDLQSQDVPWKTANIEDYLDILYYSHSGEKTVSRMIAKRVVDGVLPTSARSDIAAAVFTLFGVQWSKLYATLSFVYDPIENYRMTEQEATAQHNEGSNTDTGTIDRDATNSRTDSGTIDRDATNTRTDSGTIDKDGTQADITNKVYGFNTSTAVNSDTSTNGVDTVETHDLTFGETINETDTHDLTFGESVDETETHDLTYTNESDNSINRSLNRYGNIGVTTSQQMITSERKLWEWNFFNQVFKDIDSILCLDIYRLECD